MSSVYNFIEHVWVDRILAEYQPNDIEFWGSIMIQVIGFWLPCAMFGLVDYFAPEFSNRHKLQVNRWQPSAKRILEAAGISFRNNLISAVVQWVLVHELGKGKTLFDLSPKLPSLWEITWQFCWGMVFREVSFYYVHRAFHHPMLYSKIHKKHHKFTAPVAFAGQYATYTEQVLSNTLPIILPYVLLRTHILSFWIFLTTQLYDASAAHSGYDFAATVRRHDLHHEKFRVYYSPFGYMDWLHGTDKLPEKEHMVQ